MKCIICGKELIGRQRKYCCMDCAQIGFKKGLATTRKNTSKQVEVLYKRFLDAFNHPKTYHGNGNGFYPRVFVAACVELGFSDNSIALGMGKSRCNISRHRYKVSDKEKKIAHDFLGDERYKYGSKYPKGFSY